MREVPCPGGMMASMEDFEINGMIRLGQFLKLANLVDSGSDARDLLLTGDGAH